MIGYASATRTRRNLQQLRSHGWRILVSPDNPRPPNGMRFAADNGAWSAFTQNREFDSIAFRSLVERVGALADWVVLPDIVAGGNTSLEFSESWFPELRCLRLLLLPIQDGMDARLVGGFVRSAPNIGLFLGGSTEYKLANLYAWGVAAAALRRYYHVGRVNSQRRIRLCAEAGAHSFDGSGVSRFHCEVPVLDAARRQPSLLSPRVSR